MTYKFASLPNIDSLKEDCEVYLTTVVSKYDVSKKSTAFAYFTVIVKHWFIQQVKQNQKRQRIEAACEDISKRVEMEYLSIENPYDELRTKKEFMEHLWKEIGKWEEQGDLKENEWKVLEAVKILLENAEGIDDDQRPFNKKAVYMYLREITNLNTKQVLSNLKGFRKAYNEFRKRWDAGEGF